MNTSVVSVSADQKDYGILAIMGHLYKFQGGRGVLYAKYW
jgi:hypothetical protein